MSSSCNFNKIVRGWKDDIEDGNSGKMGEKKTKKLHGRLKRALEIEKKCLERRTHQNGYNGYSERVLMVDLYWGFGGEVLSACPSHIFCNDHALRLQIV